MSKYSAEWELKNKEKRKIQKAIEHEKYPTKRSEKKARYVKKHRERVLKQHRIYYKKNKEKVSAYNYIWRRTNSGIVNNLTALRRAAKIRATPKWLTKEHLEQIKMFYIESNSLTTITGVQHNVDHIVPLQGENVSGLHVPWNLQILTASENSAKINQFDGTYDNTSWKNK
jgi:5-methylcytosine-specific restriction endonuclease McrA